MAARVGVVLGGCGVRDGTSIHEAASILIALDRRGAKTICIAPSGPQAATVDHLTDKSASEPRDILRESARIARGNIRDIATVNIDMFDALIFPGGDGMLKNLSNFAENGPQCTVHPQVRRLVLDMHAAHKPIGMASIAPVIVVRILGETGARPKVTIGSDVSFAAAIQQMGGTHQDMAPAGIVVDEENRLVSTPCYMNDVGPWVVYQGAEKMVEQVLNMSGDPDSLYRQQMASNK